MPRLLIRSEGLNIESIALATGVNRVGRHPASDHRLDDPTVSGQHCEIVVLNDEVFVRDLESTNGTFIDREQIREAPLRPGQTLHVGAVEMALEDAPVNIAIPKLSFEQERNPFLSDGFAACINHPVSYATMECPQCQKAFCELCVHQVRRIGGAALKLCPSCGNHCRPLLCEAPVKKRKSRFGSWISKVTARMTGRLGRVDEP